MRIGTVCHSSLGGSVRVAVELANGLAERGHHVHVLTPSPPLPLAVRNDIAVHRCTGTTSSRAPVTALRTNWSEAEELDVAQRVVAHAVAARLDVLHFHYALPFAAIAPAARELDQRAGPAVVGTLHGTDVAAHAGDPERPARIAAALRQADAVTTVSRSHALLATEAFELSPAPQVIPNFVDIRRFRAAPARRRGRRRSHRPAVVHVSNFREIKNPEAVARVFVRSRQLVDAELWLVGDGEAMPRVRRLLRAAGVDDHVRYLGLQTSVERVLRQADVLLMTSRTESFCLAALEAAACGVPTIAPATGGLTELVEHGITGYLYPAGDEDEATAAVTRVLTDDALRHRMSRAAARRAATYSASAMVVRYEELYREAVRRRRGLAADGADGAPRGERQWARSTP